MKYCPYCGAGLPDDASFCTRCGKDVRKAEGVPKKEKKKPDIKILAAAALLLLAAGIAFNAGWPAFFEGGGGDAPAPLPGESTENTAVQEEEETAPQAEVVTEEAAEPDLPALYEKYFSELCASAGVLENSGRLETTLHAEEADTPKVEWYICEGIAGMDMADLDQDGRDEMIVYRMENVPVPMYRTEDTSPRKASCILADIYGISPSEEVQLLDSLLLRDWMTGRDTYVSRIGIMTLEGRDYLYHYNYESGVFSDGWMSPYTLYALDQGHMKKVYELGDIYEGSMGKAFEVLTWTGPEEYTGIVCAMDGAAKEWAMTEDLPLAEDLIEYDYYNTYACDRQCWHHLGVDLEAPEDSISGGADFWNTDLVRGGLSFILFGEHDQDDPFTAYFYRELVNRAACPASAQ